MYGHGSLHQLLDGVPLPRVYSVDHIAEIKDD